MVYLLDTTIHWINHYPLVTQYVLAVLVQWTVFYPTFLESLIIHEEKTKEITTVKEIGYVILIIIKFSELLFWFSLRIINALRSYLIHLKECLIRYPNTSKLVKKTRPRLVFPTHFSVFRYPMKHSSSCLISYLNKWGHESNCLFERALYKQFWNFEVAIR